MLSFEHVGNLFLDILESLAEIDQQLVNDSKILSKNLKEELHKTEYELDLPPELVRNTGRFSKISKRRKKTSIAIKTVFLFNSIKN